MTQELFFMAFCYLSRNSPDLYVWQRIAMVVS
jgi:hypothetical protein